MYGKSNMETTLPCVKQMGFSGGSVVKNPLAKQKTWVQSLGQEDPWRWKCQPTPVLLLGKSHEQRSLAGYRPHGHKRAGHD